MAGIGEALRLEFTGPRRMHDAADAWREVAAARDGRRRGRRPGHRPRGVRLVRVRRRVGRRERARSCRASSSGAATASPGSPGWTGPSCPRRPRPWAPAAQLRLSDGVADPGRLRARPSPQAVAAIRRGEVSKVVLARDLVGRLPAEADLRLVAATLLTAYPDCYAFAVDGLDRGEPRDPRPHRARRGQRARARRHQRRAASTPSPTRQAAHALATSTEGPRRARVRAAQPAALAGAARRRRRHRRAAVHAEAAEPVAPRERRARPPHRRVDLARPHRRAAPDGRRRGHPDAGARST